MNIASKVVLVSAVLAVWSSSLLAMTIRTANNSTNAPTPDGVITFSSLQAALDAAVDGDIIHVIGSPTSYGNVTVRKQLHIVGIGVNPMKDLPDQSIVGAITLTTGTGTSSTGSIVEGLVLIGATHIDQAVSDIIVRKCFYSNTGITEDGVNKNNILISDNIFDGNTHRAIHLNWGGNTNIVIRNNLFFRVYVEVSNGLVANNTFLTFNEFQAAFNTNNTIFVNNIFFRMQPVFITSSPVTNSIYNNNLAVGSADDTLPTLAAPVGTNTGQNNINNAIISPATIDPVNFFVNFPETGSNDWSTAHDYHLHASNPGVGAGTDGTNLGIYGGENPFNLKVGIPMIQTLNTAAAIKQGNNLPTTIGAQAQ